MRELLLSMAEGLVDHPEDIIIDMDENGGLIQLSLSVNPEDVGKVIGKQGKIANAMRQILKACAIKENCKVNLEIKEK